MNFRHFSAFVWLRWRLMINQWRRAGALSAALMIIISVGALVSSIPLFVGTFAAGTYLIPKATPDQLMYVWDGMVFFFVLFWGIGLITELQRNDPLSLSKFLHLPVSVQGAFLINYLSSLLRLSIVTFGPIMLAYALALVYVQGVAQLPSLLALAAFFLMITALTYQFQGWLASLMNNPRRRRTVIMATTMTFVLMFQLPNLINVYFSSQGYGKGQGQAARALALAEDLRQLSASIKAGEVDPQEATRRQKELNETFAAENQRAGREETERFERIVRIVNMVVPLGWLPMGAMASAEGRVLPPLLGLAGMTLIGSASLWRAYRTTIGMYQGQSSNRKAKAPTPRAVGDDRPPRGRLLEARLPWVSEPVSAIALGGFQSILRSPEAKLTLLMPLILGAVFVTMLLRGRGETMPELVRPLAGIAAIAFTQFGLLALMSNQFGVDRDGFRVFVLCAAPRREILQGKNLAHAPLALLISLVLLIAVQVLCPMRLDHALAMFPQFLTMFLLFCMVANLFSIYLPVYLSPGTLKAANPKFTTVLLQLLMFLVLFPISQGLSLLPLGVEAALHYSGRSPGRIPVCLLLTLAECAGIVFLYRASLGWLGGELQAREQKILETVTNRGL